MGVSVIVLYDIFQVFAAVDRSGLIDDAFNLARQVYSWFSPTWQGNHVVGQYDTTFFAEFA